MSPGPPSEFHTITKPPLLSTASCGVFWRPVPSALMSRYGATTPETGVPVAPDRILKNAPCSLPLAPSGESGDTAVFGREVQAATTLPPARADQRTDRMVVLEVRIVVEHAAGRHVRQRTDGIAGSGEGDARNGDGYGDGYGQQDRTQQASVPDSERYGHVVSPWSSTSLRRTDAQASR